MEFLVFVVSCLRCLESLSSSLFHFSRFNGASVFVFSGIWGFSLYFALGEVGRLTDVVLQAKEDAGAGLENGSPFAARYPNRCYYSMPLLLVCIYLVRNTRAMCTCGEADCIFYGRMDSLSKGVFSIDLMLHRIIDAHAQFSGVWGMIYLYLPFKVKSGFIHVYFCRAGRRLLAAALPPPNNT